MGHLKNMLFSGTGSGVSSKLRLSLGKIRRAYLGLLRKGYVNSRVKARRGECIRCGACCKLLYVCPHLEELPEGTTQCKIHEQRPINCRIFPVNGRDLEDRDLIAEGDNSKPCGFSFPLKGYS